MNCLNYGGFYHFRKVRERMYVDKSNMIAQMNAFIRTKEKYIAITRPNGFGKTINAEMLAAYYTIGYDSHGLFDDLMISKSKSYEKHINQHNVIMIDFSVLPGTSCYQDYITRIEEQLSQDIYEVYGVKGFDNESVGDLLVETGDSFIFILDHWEAVLFQDFMSFEDKEKYLEFLQGLLKDQTYVELAYMTGVLPVMKISSISGLNMFDEYTMMNDNVWDAYFGFCEQEVRSLCMQSEIRYEELKEWCGGYCRSDGNNLFRPSSVINVITRQEFLNDDLYGMDSFVQGLKKFREDIKDLISGKAIRMKLMEYRWMDVCLDTKEELFSFMVTCGYLSDHQGWVRVPNREMMVLLKQIVNDLDNE